MSDTLSRPGKSRFCGPNGVEMGQITPPHRPDASPRRILRAHPSGAPSCRTMKKPPPRRTGRGFVYLISAASRAARRHIPSSPACRGSSTGSPGACCGSRYSRNAPHIAAKKRGLAKAQRVHAVLGLCHLQRAVRCLHQPAPARTELPGTGGLEFILEGVDAAEILGQGGSSSDGMPVSPGPIISQNFIWFQCCEALLKMPFCATADES